MPPGLTARVSDLSTDMMQRVLDEADLLDQQEPEQLLAQQLMQRKLSDLQLVRCVQQMSTGSNYLH